MTLSEYPTDWVTELPLLQCVACDGNDLQATDDAGVACGSCGQTFAVREGMLVVKDELTGNNKVTADFYNGRQWKSYRFWRRFSWFNDRATNRWRAEVLRFLPNLSGTRLLDVAIGDGENLPSLPDDCDVYGADISVTQLRGCRGNFPRRNVRLVLGEAEALPFRDQTFDNVLSFGAFNYFNDPLGSLREMARVVKPDGLIVVTDEYPDLPNRLIGSRMGWRWLDRWILSRVCHLGSDFAAVVDRHRDLKIEPIIDEVLRDWDIHTVCGDLAYCFVGRPKQQSTAG